MRAWGLGWSVASLLVLGTGQMHAAVQYPFTVTLDAELKSGVTTITSKVTIRVDRPMSDAIRTRVSDALKFGGYPNFLNTLSPLPPMGSIQTQSATVEVRYAREDQDGETSRLVVVADRPLFFLNRDQDKAKAGYHLTVVELRIDANGAITGLMAGAARVKPAPDGGVILDDYTEELVRLKGQLAKS